MCFVLVMVLLVGVMAPIRVHSGEEAPFKIVDEKIGVLNAKVLKNTVTGRYATAVGTTPE